MFELLVLSMTLGDGPIRERLRELKPHPPAPEKTLNKAVELLTETEQSAKTGIPEALIAKAEAVVVIPDTVKAGLAAFVERTGVDEVMITGAIHDHGARLRSFEIAMAARP